jgi:hypothetical protein
MHFFLSKHFVKLSIEVSIETKQKSATPVVVVVVAVRKLSPASRHRRLRENKLECLSLAKLFWQVQYLWIR